VAGRDGRPGGVPIDDVPLTEQGKPDRAAMTDRADRSSVTS
jgi:hypothetical protein